MIMQNFLIWVDNPLSRSNSLDFKQSNSGLSAKQIEKYKPQVEEKTLILLKTEPKK